MYNPDTLSKMAEIKRREIHDRLDYPYAARDRRSGRPRVLGGIIQKVSGWVRRLAAPSPQTLSPSGTSKNVGSRR